ncbi:hypothetical protein N7454_009915 [Penicillium verhagenii]|nr:hypothetical protein N7454_009915 [Penicillium verhagenii]
MHATFFLASTLAALAAATASSTTISYLGASVTGDVDLSKYTSIVGSVVAADETATTYDIRCQEGVDSSLCAISSATPWKLVQGPATYSFSANEKISTEGGVADIFATVACSFTHTSESVSCAESVSFDLSIDGYSTASSTNVPSVTIDADQVSYHVLTVTGGLDILKSAATATATSVSSKDAAQPQVTAAPLFAALAAAAAAAMI